MMTRHHFVNSRILGGWNPSWDASRKVSVSRPLKGHKEERNRDERASKIDAAMKVMPDKLKKYEQVRLQLLMIGAIVN